MDENRRPDPNKERNDPMVAEYWQLGEDVQDKVRAAGYESPEVEGIAVDIHDLLQAADRIREELAPRIVSSDPAQIRQALADLKEELDHVRWHCDAATDYLDADMRDPERILRGAAETLDFDRPIALMFMGVLGHVTEYDEARSIVKRLLDALPPGSYLALADSLSTGQGHAEAHERYKDSGAVPYHLRTAAEIKGFFDGLELVELLIAAITPPEEVEKMMDVRGGMAAVGDMNAFLKFQAAQAMMDAARAGQPGFMAVSCFRFYGHGRMDKSPYRSAEEEETGRRRDPVAHARAGLLERALATPEQLDALDAQIAREMSAAIDFTAASPAPPPASMFRDVYGAGQPEPEPARSRIDRILARA